MNKRKFLKLAAAAAAGLSTEGLLPAGVARAADAPAHRIAVVYFTKTGHTESIAAAVSAQTNAKRFRIELEEPYPEVYQETTEIVKDELARGIARKILPLVVPLDDCDTIVLLTPTWWHHVAMPLQSWIKSVSLAGKTVLTGNSHGGGGLMHTREDFERLLPGVTLGTHLTIFGGVSADDTRVRDWLQENHLL